MFVNIKILLAIALAICSTIQAVPVWEDADGNAYYLATVVQHSRTVRDIAGVPNPIPDWERDTKYDKFTVVDNKVKRAHVGIGGEYQRRFGGRFGTGFLFFPKYWL